MCMAFKLNEVPRLKPRHPQLFTINLLYLVYCVNVFADVPETNISSKDNNQTIVLAEFYTESHAHKYIENISGHMRNIALVQKKEKAITRLFLGPYLTERAAKRDARFMKKNNISHQISYNQKKQVYTVRLGAYTDDQAINSLLSHLDFLNINNIVTEKSVLSTYQVLASVPSELTKHSDHHLDNQSGHPVYFSKEHAERYVLDLKNTGLSLKIVHSERPIELWALQIKKINNWASAKKIQKQLEQNSFKATINSLRDENEFVITVGSYAKTSDMILKYDKLLTLGYQNLYLEKVSSIIDVYSFIEDIKPKEKHKTPRNKINSIKKEETLVLDIPPLPQQSVVKHSDIKPTEKNNAVASFPQQTKKRSSLTPSIAIDEILLEAGLPARDKKIDGSLYFRTIAEAAFDLKQGWDLNLGLRLDATQQLGAHDDSHVNTDYGGNYLRYRQGSIKITAGSQIVLWGRLDGDSPSDKMSSIDLSRLNIDKLPKRRRATTALRFEKFFSSSKIDLLWQPKFRVSELPEENSFWSPIDKKNGRIIGMPNNAFSEALVRLGQIKHDDDEVKHALGIRFTKTTDEIDFGLSLLRTHISAPYFIINPQVLSSIQSGSNISEAITAADGVSFLSVHPRTWVVGADAVYDFDTVSWRIDVAYSSDTPFLSKNGRFSTKEGLDWGIGLEAYPGDDNTRVIIELTGFDVLNDRPGSDLSYTALTGNIESLFQNERWRSDLDFSIELTDDNYYFNPTFSFIGLPANDFYISYHLFGGEEQTLGGYYSNNDILMIGWRGRF